MRPGFLVWTRTETRSTTGADGKSKSASFTLSVMRLWGKGKEEGTSDSNYLRVTRGDQCTSQPKHWVAGEGVAQRKVSPSGLAPLPCKKGQPKLAPDRPLLHQPKAWPQTDNCPACVLRAWRARDGRSEFQAYRDRSSSADLGVVRIVAVSHLKGRSRNR